MLRPCVALAIRYQDKVRGRRRVYRCGACKLVACVCGTGVVSMGPQLDERRHARLEARFYEALDRILAKANAQMRLRIVPEAE
jgi:Fe-S-cluster-containing hydrogenase component 2